MLAAPLDRLVHFRSESWVKSMALYWDQLYRMVPYDYVLHDSETIREFSRLGFIQPANLGSARGEVGEPFIVVALGVLSQRSAGQETRPLVFPAWLRGFLGADEETRTPNLLFTNPKNI